MGVDLKFVRPTLVTEKERDPEPVAPSEERLEVAEPVEKVEEAWREENVAAIFDGPPTPKTSPKYADHGDAISAWCDAKLARDREGRAKRRRGHLEGKLDTKGQPRGTRVPRGRGPASG